MAPTRFRGMHMRTSVSSVRPQACAYSQPVEPFGNCPLAFRRLDFPLFFRAAGSAPLVPVRSTVRAHLSTTQRAQTRRLADGNRSRRLPLSAA